MRPDGNDTDEYQNQQDQEDGAQAHENLRLDFWLESVPWHAERLCDNAQTSHRAPPTASGSHAARSQPIAQTLTCPPPAERGLNRDLSIENPVVGCSICVVASARSSLQPAPVEDRNIAATVVDQIAPLE